MFGHAVQAGLRRAWCGQAELGSQQLGVVLAGQRRIDCSVVAIDVELAAAEGCDRADFVGADVRQAVAEGDLGAEFGTEGLVAAGTAGAAASGQDGRSQQREREFGGGGGT